MINDVNDAWGKLEAAEKDFEDWLLIEMRRMERLAHLVNKFKHKCDIHEAWTDGKDVILSKDDFSGASLPEVLVSNKCYFHHYKTLTNKQLAKIQVLEFWFLWIKMLTSW